MTTQQKKVVMGLFENKILTDEDFLYFKEKIFASSGINLNLSKKTLVQSRLNAHLNKLKIETFQEYRRYLESLNAGDPEVQSFINLMTTNKTEWFRENDHFIYLVNQFLPTWKKQGKKTLKIWSAASSSGEEAYTIAIILKKILAQTGIHFEIIGSDIDTNMIDFANNGVYRKDQLMNIPDEYHQSFDPGRNEIKEWMKVNKSIKSHVSFKQFNLKNGNYEEMNQAFDLIFCRNVMIYFTPETITEISQGLFKNAAPEAVLIISHSESLQNLKTSWKVKTPSVYTKGQLFI